MYAYIHACIIFKIQAEIKALMRICCNFIRPCAHWMQMWSFCMPMCSLDARCSAVCTLEALSRRNQVAVQATVRLGLCRISKPCECIKSCRFLWMQRSYLDLFQGLGIADFVSHQITIIEDRYTLVLKDSYTFVPPATSENDIL